MKSLKILATAVTALFVLIGSVSAQNFKAVRFVDDKNFVVKYEGVEENYLIFKVEFKAVSNNGLLRINDKVEGELYSQNWVSRAPYQIFKIEKKDGQQIVFNFSTGGKEYQKSFTANTKVVEDVTVKEDALVTL